jgi:hypothetical protein
LLFIKHIKSKKIIIVILLLLIIERIPINFPIRGYPTENFIPIVQKSDSNAVLDLPIFTDWWNGPLYDYYSILYQKPIVNGYIHWSGNTPNAKYFTDSLNSFSCYSGASTQIDKSDAELMKNQLITQLKQNNIKTVVIHKDIYHFPECTKAAYYIQTLTQDNQVWKILFQDDKTIVLWLQ